MNRLLIIGATMFAMFLGGTLQATAQQPESIGASASSQRRVKDILRKATFKRFLRREASATSDSQLKASIQQVLENDALLDQAYGEIGGTYESMSAGALTDFFQWLIDNREAIMEWVKMIIELFSDEPQTFGAVGPPPFMPDAMAGTPGIEGNCPLGFCPTGPAGPGKEVNCVDCPNCPNQLAPGSYSYSHSESYVGYGTRGAWRFRPDAPRARGSLVGSAAKGVGAVARGTARAVGKVLGVERRQARRAARRSGSGRGCGC